MNTKRKLLFSFAGLILSIVIFSTVVFAWFALSSTTSEFVVQTGNLETDTDLYRRVLNNDSTYSWVKVDTTDDADNIFENMIPGQVITLKLQMSNLGTSTIKTLYSVKFGDILVNDETDEKNIEPDAQELLNAINIEVYPYITGGDGKLDQIPVSTLTDLSNKKYASEAEVNNVTVSNYQIAYPKGHDNEFDPVAGTPKLSSYISDEILIEEDDDNLINPGCAVVYIIKFYFNPNFGYNVEENVANSNHFMNLKFTIEHLKVEYTQQKQITE